MASVIRLKPCPFCGGDVTFHRGLDKRWQIRHVNHYWPEGWHDNAKCGYHNYIGCYAEGFNKRKVAQAWNRRVTDGK